MTPKEEYEARRKQVKERQMAQQTAYEDRIKREQDADEFIQSLMQSVRAFFDGHATLHIGPMQPGIGQAVRFIKDRPPQS